MRAPKAMTTTPDTTTGGSPTREPAMATAVPSSNISIDRRARLSTATLFGLLLILSGQAKNGTLTSRSSARLPMVMGIGYPTLE